MTTWTARHWETTLIKHQQNERAAPSARASSSSHSWHAMPGSLVPESSCHGQAGLCEAGLCHCPSSVPHVRVTSGTRFHLRLSSSLLAHWILMDSFIFQEQWSFLCFQVLANPHDSLNLDSPSLLLTISMEYLFKCLI